MIGCIRFRNTGDEFVHIFEMGKYGSPVEIPGRTLITTKDAPNFTFDFVPRISGEHEFCAIKTKNTGHEFVEIHVIARRSKVYRTFILQEKTPFRVDDAPNFDFVMGKGSGNLIGIKRRNTESGYVEIHVLSHISNYQTFILQVPTPILLADGANFEFGAAEFDRAVGIKEANTGTGTIELHVLKASGTGWDLQHQTGFKLSDVPGRTWLVDPYPFELVGITNQPMSGFAQIKRSVSTPVAGFPPPPSRYTSDLEATALDDFVFKMIGEALIPAGGGL